jgi:hypothetical protein
MKDQIAGEVYSGGEKYDEDKSIIYKIGEYSINITSWDEVNAEYQKVCRSTCNRTVKGFVNYTSKEMWAIPNMRTVLHEVKHIVDGKFHP